MRARVRTGGHVLLELTMTVVAYVHARCGAAGQSVMSITDDVDLSVIMVARVMDALRTRASLLFHTLRVQLASLTHGLPP